MQVVYATFGENTQNRVVDGLDDLLGWSAALRDKGKPQLYRAALRYYIDKGPPEDVLMCPCQLPDCSLR